MLNDQIRDIQVDRLQVICRQYGWTMVQRSNDEDKTRVTFSMPTGGVDKWAQKSQIDRIKTVVDAWGWEDESTISQPTQVVITFAKDAPSEGEEQTEFP